VKLAPLPFALYILLGAVVGIFSGLFGVGGGIIMVPFLVLLAGQTQQMAQGISLAVMVPTALGNALRYYKGGNLNLWVALPLAIGAIPAGYLFGADLAQKLPESTLKTLFAMFMVVMAARIMPTASVKSMSLLLGMAFVSVGVRLVMAR